MPNASPRYSSVGSNPPVKSNDDSHSTRKTPPAWALLAAVFAFVYYALFAGSDVPLVFYFTQALAALALPGIWKEMAGPYGLGSLVLASERMQR